MQRSRNAKPMKLKSYYSPTVEDAIALARQELGPDAMLVNSRRALPETRHLGEYEVVFVTDSPTAGLEGADRPGQPPRAPDRLSADVCDLKRELETMRRALTRSAYAPQPWKRAAPGLFEGYATPTAVDPNAGLARAIPASAETTAERGAQRAAPGAFG